MIIFLFEAFMLVHLLYLVLYIIKVVTVASPSANH
jgi:hypothetical protein